MTKKEIQKLDTDTLIFALSDLMLTGRERVLKSSIRSAKAICEELQARKIVVDGNGLFERWLERYTL